MVGCKYQEICPHYSATSFTCRHNGGICANFRSYCGTFRNFEKFFENQPRKTLRNYKKLLLEVNPEYDIF